MLGGTHTLAGARVALTGIAKRGSPETGAEVRAYERRFAEVAGTRYAYSFAAGRMALYALLEALDVGADDEVILPAFTCVVVANAILYRGATPVYVDIDARTFNLDPSLLERLITPRTKAIIAQHTFGLVADMRNINRIAERHGLYVLEDCAHALGARMAGKPVGSLATAAYFSTDHSKVISTGTGGMATTDDPAIAQRLAAIQDAAPFLPRSMIRRTLWNYVCEALLLHPSVATIGKYLYTLLWRAYLSEGFLMDEMVASAPPEQPYPSRLGSTQAAIGILELERLDSNLAGRRRLGLLYEKEVGALIGRLEAGSANHAFLRYAFLAPDRGTCQAGLDKVLDMGVWFTSVTHGRDRDLEAVGYSPGSCPVAEIAASRCVNLPTHPRVRRPELILRPLEELMAAGDDNRVPRK